MSLNYYLFCEQKYDEIISNLDNIIEIVEEINNFTTNEENIDHELFKTENNINFFIEKRNRMIKLKNICNKMTQTLCNHDFEDDYIDISTERSLKITYCKLCGYTK
jgi:hypothetical protein